MTGLSGEELLAWVERTSDGWRGLLQEHPHLLALECDIMSTGTVAKLLQHIVAVELRYAQRLLDLPERSYEDIGYSSVDDLFATHAEAISLLRQLLSDPEADLEQTISVLTRSAGRLRASRRTVLVHALMHSIRHYAQLATLVRQHGVKPGWPMDYLLMGAQRE